MALFFIFLFFIFLVFYFSSFHSLFFLMFIEFICLMTILIFSYSGVHYFSCLFFLMVSVMLGVYSLSLFVSFCSYSGVNYYNISDVFSK